MTPAFAPEIYAQKRHAIEHLAREAEQTCPQNPTRELADYLDVACLDRCNHGPWAELSDASPRFAKERHSHGR